MRSVEIQMTVTISPESAARMSDVLVRAIREGTSQPNSLQGGVYANRDARNETGLSTSWGASDHRQLNDRSKEGVGLLINSDQASKLLGVSSRKLWQMHNSGVMPRPIRLGSLVRWGYEELRAWVNAGCPPDDEWKWPV